MQFKSSIEKLEKGWQVSILAENKEKAQEIIDEVAENSGAEDQPRFEASLKELEDGSYRVKIYRSKLSQVQEFIKEMFLRFQDEVETSSDSSQV